MAISSNPYVNYYNGATLTLPNPSQGRSGLSWGVGGEIVGTGNFTGSASSPVRAAGYLGYHGLFVLQANDILSGVDNGVGEIGTATVVSSSNVDVMDQDIRANTGENKRITVLALDDAGDPVDLSGYSNLEFSASDRCRNVFVEQPATGANGSFSFTLPEIENDRSGLWTLRETTNGNVVMSGKIRVAFNAEGIVA